MSAWTRCDHQTLDTRCRAHTKRSACRPICSAVRQKANSSCIRSTPPAVRCWHVGRTQALHFMVALPSRPAHENRYLNASEPLTDLSGSSFEPPTCPVILMCAAFATQLRPISAAAWPSQVQPQVGQRARPKACRCSKHTLLAHSQACSVRPPARAGRTRRAAQGQLRQPGADRRPEQDCPGRGPHRRSLCSRPALAGASHAALSRTRSPRKGNR